MYKTEKEILGQYAALEKTYAYMMEKAPDIKRLLEGVHFASVTFTGSGSSYSLCRSAEWSLKLRIDRCVHSYAAGDLLINFSQYKSLLKDTLIVVPSRSGSTSEVIMAVKQAKKEFGVPCIAICATTDSPLSQIADMTLEIPWAFDESVCQTRTITNFYAAHLMLIGIMTEDTKLLKEIKKAIEQGDAFIQSNLETLRGIGQNDAWDDVVTLGDAELTGIVEEGALAFKEICQLQSNYYHILDVRHGPAVLIRDKTLVILATVKDGKAYQKSLVADLKNQGALLVTVGEAADSSMGADYHFTVPGYENAAVAGIPFILIPQLLSFYKAISRGTNPDLPQGLNPWIKL